MLNGYKVISLCISKAGSERNVEFIKALNTAVIQKGYRLFIYHTCSDLYWKTRSEEVDKSVFELIDYDITDAVIIFDESFYDKSVESSILKNASEKEVPVIFIGGEHPENICFSFGYEQGFEQVVRHVVEFHGIADICFIAGVKGDAFSERRVEVYKKVLAENHIEFCDERLYYGDYWWGPTQAAAESIIASGKIPQAVICANDSMAITVCEVFQKHGYKIPEDLIVTGFDGIWGALSHNPPITTCKCDYSIAAEKITAITEKVLNGEQVSKQNSIDFYPAIYRSCGCNRPAPFINVGDLLRKVEDKFNKYQDDERFLYEMTEGIMFCDSPDKFPEHFKNINFYNTYIMLNRDCIDGNVNPTENKREKSFDERMYIIYESEAKNQAYPKIFSRKNILPDIEKVMEQHNPVLFSALGFCGVPMGFVCFTFEVKTAFYCKISQYVTAFNNAVGSYRLVKYLKYTAESIENMSGLDFMTGLLNRKGFNSRLSDIVEYASEENKSILVASIDIDGLKYINDNFGHEDGDFAIKTVSDAVKELPLAKKLCGRFGGDEMVVCAAVDEENAEEIFQKSIEAYLERANNTGGKEYTISASIGIYISDTGNFDFEYALKQSDEKMYAVKAGRPNRRRK